jgi:GNAT superfamily N-acetyltransferase
LTVEYRGFYPGVIGRIVEAHAVYYHEHWDLDRSFEIQVGRELSDFAAGFDPGRDGLWAALTGGEFAGSVAVDGAKAEREGARLRWFLVVPDCQGKGIGRGLLRRALDFCRGAGHGKVYLWTFQGLDAARRLYEGEGFTLTEEHTEDHWGRNVVAQRFDLDLTGGDAGGQK